MNSTRHVWLTQWAVAVICSIPEQKQEYNKTTGVVWRTNRPQFAALNLSVHEKDIFHNYLELSFFPFHWNVQSLCTLPYILYTCKYKCWKYAKLWIKWIKDKLKVFLLVSIGAALVFLHSGHFIFLTHWCILKTIIHLSSSKTD